MLSCSQQLVVANGLNCIAAKYFEKHDTNKLNIFSQNKKYCVFNCMWQLMLPPVILRKKSAGD